MDAKNLPSGLLFKSCGCQPIKILVSISVFCISDFSVISLQIKLDNEYFKNSVLMFNEVLRLSRA